MKSGLSNTVVSAIVGGIVGAVVAFSCTAFIKQTTAMPNFVDKLKIGELIVTEKMMLWKDGDDDCSLLIQNGGMLAKARVIGSQLCANAVLANCVLTTPDSPLSSIDQCQIFTEMGSSKAEGGLLTVRSPDGAFMLSNPNGTRTGSAYTITYDTQANPICLFRQNESGIRLLGQFIMRQAGQDGTIAIFAPSATPGQGGQTTEVSQTNAVGSSANLLPGGMIQPESHTLSNPTPGLLDQSAMYGAPVPR